MLTLILGRKPPLWVLVLVDQTTIDGVEGINAAIPLEGRAVPVAGIDFEYPWNTLAPPSQNTIECYLLTWLAEAAPPHTRLLLVFDRGYARVGLIKDLNRGRQPLLIRAPHKVIVQTKIQGRRRRLSLGRLPHRTNAPVRYWSCAVPQPESRTGGCDRLSGERISTAMVRSGAAGLRVLAAHHRSDPLVSPADAH